jgi:hypothetical protein
MTMQIAERQRTEKPTRELFVAEKYRGMRAMTDDSVEPVKSGEENYQSSKKWIRCDTPNCVNAAAGLLALRFFCISHFITHCYEKLERCNANPLQDSDVVTSVAIDRFLQQCVAQAGELVRPVRGFDNLDRARLFDIFLWASDLVARRSIFKIENSAAASGNPDSNEISSLLESKKAGAN